MSVAARIARLALVATVAATAVMSVAGVSSPVPALAAPALSAPTSTSGTGSTTQLYPNLSQRARIVKIAESHVGAHYRFGAEGEKGLFDCSGLVFSVFKDAG